VTVPVGVVDPFVATVAVKVTAWPKLDGLREETSAVVVAAPLAFSLVLMSTPTVLLVLFATTISGLPSPLTSATATE
jgi:hypothetical protein